jgi:F-type H+-transporting ATPase subunit c
MKKLYTMMVLMSLTSVQVMAEDGGASMASGITDKGLLALAAGIAIGLAAFGGALGQGKAAAAAFEGIARNPAAQGKIFIPLIIGLALIESLVIYALVIAFNLGGKI